MSPIQVALIFIGATVGAHALSFTMGKTATFFSDKQAVIGTSIPTNGGYQHLGMYYITIGLGTTAQQLTVQVDTGSSTLGVYSTDCSACSSATRYSQSGSGSASTIMCSNSAICTGTSSASYPRCLTVGSSSQCAFTVSYGDSSKMQGALTQDVISLGVSNVTGIFGRIVTSLATGGGAGLFEPAGVDGILGLAHDSLNCAPNCFPTVLSYFAAAGVLNPYLFAMCFTSSSGNLDVGVIDPAKHNGTLNYIPLVTTGSNAGYYTVVLDSSTAGSTTLATNTQVIFDSGTTLIIGSSAWTSAFHTAAANAPQFSTMWAGNSAVLTTSQLNSWPTLSFSFVTTTGSTYTVSIPPSKYMINVGGSPTQYQLGVSSTGTSPMILGDTFLQMIYSVFDVTNNKIGIAPVNNCANNIVQCPDSNPNCTQATPTAAPTPGPGSSTTCSSLSSFIGTCSSPAAPLPSVRTSIIAVMMTVAVGALMAW